MNKRILGNIFSNWFGLAVTIVIAFVVSPILVRGLGKELYGVWILIVSITGYFTVLDFGVNTAIVRYISSRVAKGDHQGANATYSCSIAIFGLVAGMVVFFSIVFGFFFPDLFDLHHFARSYLYVVFLLSGIDLACGLLFSVFLGTLTALQEFTYINASSTCVNIVRSVALVIALQHGASLLCLALLQLIATLMRALLQYSFIRRKFTFLRMDWQIVNLQHIRDIYNYSIYSFIIAVALKLLFYTDSLVIGACIGVSEVVFYAIPSTLLDYLEKFVWAMIAVLIPVISKNEAIGDKADNVKLYTVGTRYTLLVIMPFIISLYYFGGDFIRLWMGLEFGERSTGVLKILLVGFGFSFSQLIAHGILKGISKHKVLSFILAIEAIANLVMSIILAKPYGILGVAIGTTVPLIVATFVIIIYTCKILNIKIWSYVYYAYFYILIAVIADVIILDLMKIDNVSGFFDVFIKSGIVAIISLVVALPMCLEVSHRKILLKLIKCF